jgi:hypothetical protein
VAIAVGGGVWPLASPSPGAWRGEGIAEWFCLIFGGLCMAACLRPFVPLGGWRYAIVQQDGLLARRGARKYSIAWEQVRSVWLMPTMSVWLWLARPGRLLCIRGVFEQFEDARRLAGQVRTRVRIAKHERATSAGG